ncbi:CoA transferase subunit A [Alicyclobacillus sp. SO9]|uniref:CoA transferase subunit A n=1 Tax=Alicyclobacillus sp. SO9 TaxID=2665646 RepID=UPI0018E783A2|nr:CoA transferase subunit A [Alicyclobacillus sp. SO9]QQE79772.1 CoA transferase subunit A [Alicyclobacillus sp. SO9]
MRTGNNTYGKIMSLNSALTLIRDGIRLMYGGFGGIGSPPSLIDAIYEAGVKDLILIGNDSGFPDIGIGKLVTARRASKLITSHIGSNPNAGDLMNLGELEVEFSSQGTLAERIRAGGVGLGGILTDIGLGTQVEENKQVVMVDGEKFLLETPLTADVAIVYAAKADPFGNLVYNKTARNFNPLVAMAGSTTIAEVDEIVPLGDLDPEEIVTPGVFVDVIVRSKGVNWKWVWEQRKDK